MLVLSDFIDLLCRNVRAHHLDNASLYTIFEKFKKEALKNDMESYLIRRGSDIMPVFLLNNWTFRDTIEDNLINLSVISGIINDTFTVPSGKQITNEQISAMSKLADRKFLIKERFLLDKPIDILLVNNTYRYANALYYINPNPDVVIKDLIVLTHVADDKVCPEFALLHELGHMVHTRITQKRFVAPRSFEILHPVIFEYTPPDRSVPYTKWPKKWFAEWFAECFAIAVLHKTPYSYLDYHTEISDEDKDFIKTYMTVLLDTLEYNKFGRRTWETLEKYSKKMAKIAT